MLPVVNFFRNLSPLAWIPFAILWFGIGDAPAIFLIFIAALFPIILATFAAVENIPSVYFRVANDYGMEKGEILRKVTFPAIAPQIITIKNLSITESHASAVKCWFAVTRLRQKINMEFNVCVMIT